MAERAGADVDYRDIYDVVRSESFVAGHGEHGYRANVRAMVKRIRRKFTDIDPGFAALDNYPGFGYRWRSRDRSQGPERLRWYRSIRVQCAALAAVLIVLPMLMFSVLAQADAERRSLVLNAVSETGGVVAAALAPRLRELRPADSDLLAQELARFSAADRSIRVLFRPSGEAGSRGFYLLAAAPPIPPDQAEIERQQLLRLGIVSGADEGCTAQLAPGRTPTFLSGGAEVMTSVLPVLGDAGCWAVVIATGEQRVLGAARPGRY